MLPLGSLLRPLYSVFEHEFNPSISESVNHLIFNQIRFKFGQKSLEINLF